MLAVLARRLGHHRIGGIENLLRGAVVLRQRDHLGARLEPVGKTQNVVDGGGAKRIDRLRIVADDREPGAIGPQRVQDLRLQHVRVLVFVDQHVIEMPADVLRRAADRTS